MKNYLFILLLFLLQLGCSDNKPNPAISQLEYNFYSTAMDSLFGTEKLIVLRDSLIIPYQDELIGLTLFGDSIETGSRIDKTRLSNSERIDLIPYERLVEISNKKDFFWDSFFQEYPNSIGWVTLSTISFNKDSSEAIFHVLHGCGEYCGGEIEIIYQKEEKNWKLAYAMQSGES